MTNQAIKALKKYVNEYQRRSGASRLGAFRDIATDLMHIAFADKDLDKAHRKGCDFSDWDSFLYDSIFSEGHRMFWEEMEDNERELIEKMKPKELLCFNINDFNFESTKKLFEQRLKGDVP